MSRKNMHGKVGVKFKAGWTTSKNNSMLRNVVTELIVNEKVEVTLATAKQLSPLADKMVTFAKKGDKGTPAIAPLFSSITFPSKLALSKTKSFFIKESNSLSSITSSNITINLSILILLK